MAVSSRAYLATCAIGALLHDIGKFRERAGLPAPAACGKYSHEPHSHAFVNAHARAFSQADRVAAMALRHHVAQLPDERILAVADRLASAERAEATPGQAAALPAGRKHRPLLSLLASMYGRSDAVARAPLEPLSFTRSILFPCADEPDQNAYADLWSAFEAEATRIQRVDDVETWLYLLQKYTWCMPSSDWEKEVPDVSLFDHSRATAALAVCLGAAYGNDEAQLNRLMDWTARGRAGGDTKAALLVRLDVRGIQAFLYSLKARGAAKSLRGRSTYIGLVCEAMVRRVLAELDMPITQALYSGGGHAYLLLPPGDGDELCELRAKLERAAFALHGGELSVSIGWAMLTAADLCSKEAKGTRGDGSKLKKKWDEASLQCNQAKARPMAEQKLEWLALNVFAVEEQGGLSGRCAVCHAELGGSATGDERDCPLCASFQELGRELLRICTRSGGARGGDCESFHDPGREEPLHCRLAVRSVAPAEEPGRATSWKEALQALGLEARLGDAGADGDTVLALDGTVFLPEAPNPACSYGFRPVATVFPTDAAGDVLEFGELAGRARGVKRLAALRMDVDNLGLLFSTGFAEHTLSRGRGASPSTYPHDRFANYTLSRVAAVSSSLRWFYEGYLNNLCAEWAGKVYGLYAGGDDLFFVGSWDVMPEVAQRIRDDFHAYCGGNPKITVSAGISLFADKYPLYQAAEDSEANLDASKRHGDGRKNAVTFLGRTVGWEEWPEVVQARATLSALTSGNGPSAILQRLRALRAMSQADRQRASGTPRWRWLAAYSLSRMAGQYPKHRAAIAAVRDGLTDEAALERWALAARWVQLEQR
ncbi:MAG TPA: type III-A CRISPR-associated protein Cas10/Csm1 [Chthonomonadales bacterium]|nr:type III-A CRISPR-associated protein Cas10/Csm1 [Chthonomonadales bacterium]